MLKRAFKGQASCIHKLKHKVHGRPASPATFDSAIRVRVRKCALWRAAPSGRGLNIPVSYSNKFPTISMFQNEKTILLNLQ